MSSTGRPFSALAKNLAIPLCALAALSVAACGSSGATSNPRAERRADGSSAQFAQNGASIDSSSATQRTLAAAEAACRELNLEVATTPLKSGTRNEVLRIVPKNIERERVALRKLTALEPPSSLRVTWRQMLAVRQALIGQLVAFLGAARRDDPKTSHALSASKKTLHQRLRTISERAGLHSCATLG